METSCSIRRSPSLTRTPACKPAVLCNQLLSFCVLSLFYFVFFIRSDALRSSRSTRSPRSHAPGSHAQTLLARSPRLQRALDFGFGVNEEVGAGDNAFA